MPKRAQPQPKGSTAQPKGSTAQPKGSTSQPKGSKPSSSQAKAPTKAQSAAAKQPAAANQQAAAKHPKHPMTQEAARRIQVTQQIEENKSHNNSAGRLFAVRAQRAAAMHAHHGTTMGKK